MEEETTTPHHDLPPVIGVDLGGTQLRVAVLQGNQLLARASSPTGENPTPDRIIPRIYNAIQQVLHQAGISLDQAAGIGISVAGPLDSRTGIIFTAPNLPGWNHIYLGEILTNQYKIPVTIENDANASLVEPH